MDTFNRRLFLGSTLSLAALSALRPGAFAEELAKTPRMTEGPFYPDKLPLDTDNDLIVVNDTLTAAVGEITHLTGRIVDVTGTPLGGAVIEIWQCDAHGAYLHSKTGNRTRADKNFQGFGRFTTNRAGEYYFRTIKPVPYPGRTPHIHVKVKKGGKEVLCSQIFIKGHDGNAKDGIWKGIKDDKQRDNVTVAFEPVKESKVGELAAKFDVVLGTTPERP
jgi:protocatechuate 3,4-dioxygenase, beta subunit